MICFSYHGEKGFQVNLEVFGGGYGASAVGDGCDAVDSPLSNCSNTPVEVMDIQCDYVRIVGYKLEPNSFGHGRFPRWCGGSAGIMKCSATARSSPSMRIASASSRVASSAARLRSRDFAASTATASSSRSVRNRPSICARGDVVEVFLGGGGGYGAPSERDKELVERDVAEELLSPDAAKKFYGLQMQSREKAVERV